MQWAQLRDNEEVSIRTVKTSTHKRCNVPTQTLNNVQYTINMHGVGTGGGAEWKPGNVDIKLAGVMKVNRVCKLHFCKLYQ